MRLSKVFNEHSPVWQNPQALNSKVNAFITKTAEMNELALQQSTAMSGLTIAKNEKHLGVAEEADRIAGSIRSWAKDAGDTELREKLKFSPTDLRKGNSVTIIQRMDVILHAAQANAAGLAGHGVTQQDIDAFTNSRNELSDAFGVPRFGMTVRTQQTQQLHEICKEIDDLLKEHIDELMKTVKVAHPQFYKLYRAARKVYDYQGKKNKKGGGQNPPAGTLPPPQEPE